MNLLSLLTTVVQSETKPEEVTPAIHLTTETAEQSSYFIARVLMDCVNWLLGLIGMEGNANLFIWLYVIVVFAFAFGVGLLVQWALVFFLRKINPHVKSNMYNYMIERKFFTKLCRIIPPLIFLILIQFTLYKHLSIASWLSRLSWIYIVIIMSQSLSVMVDVVWRRLDMKENTKRLPLKGIAQVIKLVIWIFATIIMAAILFNRSPGTLLAGLGAFAAVLMLIFKDSILGVVAGVQLAQNDSLHVGDWIAVNGSDANGTVEEVSLTAVKITNWDKTVSTVPPYNLITSGFKNYRPMQESNTRRIQRSYMIDADSVVETTKEMLDEFSKIPLISGWIQKQLQQRASGVIETPEEISIGTIDTNLGIFRAYVTLYLRNSPYIDKASDLFVTTLAQTPNGIPLQLYCFTNTSKWIPYEGIQAAIFEHLAVMLYRFHLYVFESESGRDTIIEGFMSPGKNPDAVFGMPYPFFYGNQNPNVPGTPPPGLYPNSPTPPQNLGDPQLSTSPETTTQKLPSSAVSDSGNTGK
ncbi:MAG: mechanosensitive ion channel [Bacteroidales bacterium]|nr:mechanosensitive ion channel [Bacteroidales bacterium]MDE6231156.1 mechanosensitive ion channel family protein [Muribaculaceae bacterium]